MHIYIYDPYPEARKEEPASLLSRDKGKGTRGIGGGTDKGKGTIETPLKIARETNVEKAVDTTKLSLFTR